MHLWKLKSGKERRFKTTSGSTKSQLVGLFLPRTSIRVQNCNFLRFQKEVVNKPLESKENEKLGSWGYK